MQNYSVVHFNFYFMCKMLLAKYEGTLFGPVTSYHQFPSFFGGGGNSETGIGIQSGCERAGIVQSM
jgi:hypothetical protein